MGVSNQADDAEKQQSNDVRTASLSDTATKTPASSDLDETYEVYRQQHDARDLDPAAARAVLRKIDLHILPLLMGTYMLQYLDKSSINFASVYGLEEGTDLHGQDYSWLSSIFYFGYLIAQYPAGYLLQRLPIGKFVGGTILAWGTLIITTPACTNFAGIATNRFLLGMTEAVVNPSFVLVMAMWYQSVSLLKCSLGVVAKATLRRLRPLSLRPALTQFPCSGRATPSTRDILLYERRCWDLRRIAGLRHCELSRRLHIPLVLTLQRGTSRPACSDGVRRLDKNREATVY